MIQVMPSREEPTYEELRQKCARLKGSLRESRRAFKERGKWNAALLVTSVISTVLLALTWGGYIII